MRFDWTDLQLFLHTCEAGSLTAAAERSHLTLAAASARIRGMEDQAGTQLLQRHSRGVRPTAAGDTLAQHARAVLAQMALLQGALAEHGQGARGRIRLLCNSSAAFVHLPPLLGAFLQAHRTVDVSVEESPSHLTVQALRDGAADLGVVSSAVDASDLDARDWRADPLVLVLPRGHALARQRQLSFAQALDYDIVGCGANSALHAHLSLQAAQLGKAMRIRASLAHFNAVCALVEQGVGVAVMPAALLQMTAGKTAGRAASTAAAKATRLTVRPLTDAWARRTLRLCRAVPAQGAAQGTAAGTAAGAALAQALADFLLAAGPAGPHPQP